MAPDMGKKRAYKKWYLDEAWPPHLILHPVLLSLISLSMSYPDYPPLIPQPASPFRISIHILSLFVPILQSPPCLMPVSCHVPGRKS